MHNLDCFLSHIKSEQENQRSSKEKILNQRVNFIVSDIDNAVTMVRAV